MRQPKHGRREKILIVHHIVERKAGVGTRCGKDLKEGTVAAVGGIGIATAVGIAEAEPWIEEVSSGLPAGFGDEGSRTLVKNTPTAILNGSPEQEVELAVILRVEDMDVVGTISPDADVVMIGGSEGRRAIVGFKDRAAFIYVAEAEETKLANRVAAIDACCVGTIEEVDVEFSHSVDLINAARRTSAEEGEVAGFGVEG